MKRTIAKGIAWVLLLCMLTGLFSGCTDSSKYPRSSTELVLAGVGDEPEAGFDPTTGWGAYGTSFLHSTLLRYDETLTLVNDAAEGWQVSGDGRTYSVQLRRDVNFSDGKGMTAHDVKFTYETAKKSSSSVDLTMLDSVEVTSAYSVDFHLNTPSSVFASVLTTIGIVPMNGYDETYGQHPVGSGPYKLVQWDKGQQIVLTPNEYYYGDKPYYTRLTILFLSESAAFAAAKSGTVDVAIAATAVARNQKIDGMQLVNVKSCDNRGISFPMQKVSAPDKNGNPVGNDVTCDPAIRKALNVGISREALVKGILAGNGSAAYSLCDSLPWFNEETVFADNDPGLAKQLLEEAGWVDENGDGVREKNGISATFKLYYPAGDSVRQSLAVAVADFAKTIGIAIELHGASWNEIERVMHAEAVMFGFGNYTPLEVYNIYDSAMSGDSYNNPNYYQNSTVDGYLKQAMEATSQEEAYEYWKKAQFDGTTGFAYQGDAAWMWLVNADHVYYVRDGVDIGTQRLHPHGHDWPLLWNVANWKAK